LATVFSVSALIRAFTRASSADWLKRPSWKSSHGIGFVRFPVRMIGHHNTGSKAGAARSPTCRSGTIIGVHPRFRRIAMSQGDADPTGYFRGS
jgi:hypothetical protein